MTRKAKIEKLIYRGWAEGEDLVTKEKILLRWALPGERVEYRFFRRKKGVILADLTAIVKPSPWRIKPRCSWFGRCGGCSWSNLTYQQELAWKEWVIREVFETVAQVDLQEKINPIIRSKRRYGYRGKTELTFSLDPKGQLVAGFHQPGRPDQVLAIDRCWLHRPIVNQALMALRRILPQTSLPVYQPRTGQGVLRSIIFRTNREEELLIGLIVENQEKMSLKEKRLWLDQFRQQLGKQLVSFWLIKERRRPGEPVEVAKEHWWGAEFLTEAVAGIDWPIGPLSFFQNNAEQAEKMIDQLRRWTKSHLASSARLLDLYAGTGFLSLPLAHLVAEVVAVEIDAEAVVLGQKLIQARKVKNYQFFLGDSSRVLTRLLEQGLSFEAVIIDPPRAGLSKKTLRSLLMLRPQFIFYISCSPVSQARDLAYLIKKGGYRLIELQPIDMFPCTWHVESMALLRRQ